MGTPLDIQPRLTNPNASSLVEMGSILMPTTFSPFCAHSANTSFSVVPFGRSWRKRILFSHVVVVAHFCTKWWQGLQWVAVFPPMACFKLLRNRPFDMLADAMAQYHNAIENDRDLFMKSHKACVRNGAFSTSGLHMSYFV